MNTELSQTVLARLSELRALCPDMRFGQVMATLGLLAEDDPGRSLWDIEDEELLTVIERFRHDLQRRDQSVAWRRETEGPLKGNEPATKLPK